MKAALAGAAAAAVWQAPRIDGLSIAPDIAQAANCGAVPARNVIHASDQNVLTQCWGNLFGVCNDTVFTPAAFGKFTIGISIDGTDVGTGFGFVNVNLAGIDPPFQSCTASVIANCVNDLGGNPAGSAAGTPISRRFTANGNALRVANPAGTGQFSCNDLGEVPGNVGVTVQCLCADVGQTPT